MSAASARTLDSARVLVGQGRLVEAQAALLRVLSRLPIDPDAAALLCVVSTLLGDSTRAAYWAERSADAAPESPLAQVNLIAALGAAGNAPRAIEAGRAAKARFPEIAPIAAALAYAYTRGDRRLDAVQELESAAARWPDDQRVYANAVPIALNAGRSDLALRWAQRSCALAPGNADALYFLIAAFNYADATRPEEITPALEAYDRAMTLAHGPARTSWGITPDPERPLRVGIISGDLRSHPVPAFCAPFFEHHDSTQFDIFCYSTAAHEDAVSESLRTHAAHWRRIDHLDARALCQRLADDAIDVLIDLSGHTPGHAMPAVHLKPAPLILTWIGFPASPGLRSVDFRITDALCDAPERPWIGLERPLRFAQCYVPYRPPASTPPLAPAPRTSNGFITFGSFSSIMKLTDSTLRLWASAMNRVSGSRLIYKAVQLTDDRLRADVRARMLAAGIPVDRVEIEGPVAGPAATMAEYARVDISLDTFPYHGMTTTCESLWMGVPMIALAGAISAARVNCSLLSAAGLPDLVAQTPDEFADIAARLASDTQRLDALRSPGAEGLRSRMKLSPLRDEVGHTRRFESAIREQWRAWCTAQGTRAGAASR